METQTNSSIVGVGMGQEVFAETWVIVTDSNGCDIQVTVDDLLDGIPSGDTSRYVKVFYDNQLWWIHENNHFPI